MGDPSQLQLERAKVSALALANAAELISGVIADIAGNDVSNSIGGERATKAMIQTIALQRITSNLEGQVA